MEDAAAGRRTAAGNLQEPSEYGLMVCSVFFCGTCSADGSEGLVRGMEEALESLGLLSDRIASGGVRLWCGVQTPRIAARIESTQGVAAVAGELLWDSGQPEEEAQEEVQRLQDCLRRQRPEELTKANGTFAAVVWDSDGGKLWLAADSLGGRPLYFAQSGGTVVFSTILEILLRLPAVPRTFDFTAFVEQEAFCYPLGDRTLYREIRVLQDSEYLCWTPAGVRRARYFDWSQIEFRPFSLEQAARDCAAALAAAVRERAPQAGATAQVLLSGGLDSRCVAALLHGAGVPVRAATLLLPSSQDYHYAKRFASLLGIELREAPYSIDPPPVTTGTTTAGALLAASRPFQPGRVFSGDGGGETFGFLLMPPDVMALLSRNEVDAAVACYVGEHCVPVRPFRRPWREIVRQRPLQAMRAALDRWPHVPPQKAMHLFLLSNDMRRHLHEVFEAAPRLGLDLTVPFYDRRVIRSVLQLAPPLEPYLGHRLYHEILKLLPESCLRVPWQVYPGHLPCPVQEEKSESLQSQWELSKADRRRGGRICQRTLTELFRGRIPGHIVNVPVVALAAALHRAGIRDFSHLFRPVLALTDAVHAGRRTVEAP